MNQTKTIERLQESLALLKILAMSRKSLEDGKVKPFREAFRYVRESLSHAVQGHIQNS